MNFHTSTEIRARTLWAGRQCGILRYGPKRLTW